MDEVAHRLEERPEHLAALGADVAHHLELLVDDHEELVDLLLVLEEVEEARLEVALVTGLAAESERAADRVHPDVAAVHRDVPLGAGADEVAVAGEEHEGPVRAALALEQPLEDGQRLVVPPVGDGRAVVAADHQVRALALPDLVGDDGLDELAVLLVVDVEPAAVRERHLDVVDRLDHLGDRELPLALDVHDDQRRTVVVRLEPPLAHLPERDRQQPVGDVVGFGDALFERHVQDRLDDAPACRPTSPTVSRSPARVDLRMIAHASCPRSASIASRALDPGATGVSDMRRPYFRVATLRGGSSMRPAGVLPCDRPVKHPDSPATCTGLRLRAGAHQASTGVTAANGRSPGWLGRADQGPRKSANLPAWHIDGIRGARRPQGLVAPVARDPTGMTGPTEGQAEGPYWRQTSAGMYVPADVDGNVVEQRILEQAGRIRSYGAVTAWAALRWHGGNFFDGTSDGGRGQLPVPLVVHSKLRPRPALHHSPRSSCRARSGRAWTACPSTTVQRALFDEVRRIASVREKANAISMAAAARLISTRLFGHVRRPPRPLDRDPGRPATPYVWRSTTAARRRSSGCCWSGGSTRIFRCRCSTARCIDLDGRLIGIPDLFDAEAGLRRRVPGRGPQGRPASPRGRGARGEVPRPRPGVLRGRRRRPRRRQLVVERMRNARAPREVPASGVTRLDPRTASVAASPETLARRTSSARATLTGSGVPEHSG